MTILSVRHVTTYRYRRPIAFGEHRMMLRPRDSYDQRLLESELVIEPKPSTFRWIHDVFGNCVAIAGFADEASELRFESRIRLDHCPSKTPDFRIEEYAKTYPFSYRAEEAADLFSSIERRYADPERQLDQWVRKFVPQGRPVGIGELLATLTQGIKESFTYERRFESGTHPPLTTLNLRRGTCRDFALLMMESVRCLGLAARFVTGYIYVPDRDVEIKLDGGSTHAWCQVYLPGAGWVEFDPTNGIVGNRDLIRVAVARDPSQAVPLTGTFFGATDDEIEMAVSVQVTTSAARIGKGDENY
jgi:transglutaminase-like putative cysteine protease